MKSVLWSRAGDRGEGLVEFDISPAEREQKERGVAIAVEQVCFLVGEPNAFADKITMDGRHWLRL